MTRRNISLYWGAVALAALLIAAAFYLARSHPRTVPLAECSDVYRRYADTPGVNAAYIKDYRVNDTLTICATVLEVTNDSAWKTISMDFSFEIQPQLQQSLSKGLDVLSFSLGSNHPTSCGMSDDDIAVSSFRDKYICIFHNINPALEKEIIDAIFDKMFSAITNKHKFNENEKDN